MRRSLLVLSLLVVSATALAGDRMSPEQRAEVNRLRSLGLSMIIESTPPGISSVADAEGFVRFMAEKLRADSELRTEFERYARPLRKLSHDQVGPLLEIGMPAGEIAFNLLRGGIKGGIEGCEPLPKSEERAYCVTFVLILATQMEDEVNRALDEASAF